MEKTQEKEEEEIRESRRSKRFFAVRKHTTGEEWIDFETESCTPQLSRETAQELDKKYGKAWKKDNPIVRIGRFKLEEVF